MTIWMAIALQAVPPGAVADPGAGRPPEYSSLRPPMRCEPSAGSGNIVICGRSDRNDDQRLPKLDPRFERTRSDDGLFTRGVSEKASLGGGGPKGSVGITLKLGL